MAIMGGAQGRSSTAIWCECLEFARSEEEPLVCTCGHTRATHRTKVPYACQYYGDPSRIPR